MRQKSFLALIAIATLLIGCKSYNHILEDIYDKDQSVREWTVGMTSLSADEIAEYSYEMAQTDSLNQTTVFDILDKEGWPSHLSDKANRAIWLVIDHSDASNRIKYLDLVKVKAEEGVLSKSDYAILKDRTLMENGLAQIYGTQIKMAAASPVQWPRGLSQVPGHCGGTGPMRRFGNLLIDQNVFVDGGVDNGTGYVIAPAVFITDQLCRTGIGSVINELVQCESEGVAHFSKGPVGKDDTLKAALQTISQGPGGDP